MFLHICFPWTKYRFFKMGDFFFEGTRSTSNISLKTDIWQREVLKRREESNKNYLKFKKKYWKRKAVSVVKRSFKQNLKHCNFQMEQTFFLTRRKICDQNFQCMYVHYNNVLIEQVNGKYALKKGTELNRIKWHRQVCTFPFSNARKTFLTRRLAKRIGRHDIGHVLVFSSVKIAIIYVIAQFSHISLSLSIQRA